MAVTITISNVPSSIENTQEFEVDVEVSGPTANTTNYLRAEFSVKSSEDPYFGYTYSYRKDTNTFEWYNGTEGKQFSAITIDSEKKWSGKLKIKPDSESPHFKGKGNYFLKVARYTESGSLSDSSNSVSLFINAPDPTSTPTPTPSPTVTPSPSPTPTKTPTPPNTPTPTKIPTPTKVPTPTKSPTPKPTSTQTTSTKISSKPLAVNSSGDVLAASDTSPLSLESEKKDIMGVDLVPSPTPTQGPTAPTKILGESNINNQFVILIAIGVILVLSCGILLIRKYFAHASEE